MDTPQLILKEIPMTENPSTPSTPNTPQSQSQGEKQSPLTKIVSALKAPFSKKS